MPGSAARHGSGDDGQQRRRQRQVLLFYASSLFYLNLILVLLCSESDRSFALNLALVIERLLHLIRAVHALNLLALVIDTVSTVL